MAVTELHELHMIQYRDPIWGRQVTTVLCPEHRSTLLGALRANGRGCGATTAPILSSCDQCRS